MHLARPYSSSLRKNLVEYTSKNSPGKWEHVVRFKLIENYECHSYQVRVLTAQEQEDSRKLRSTPNSETLSIQTLNRSHLGIIRRNGHRLAHISLWFNLLYKQGLVDETETLMRLGEGKYPQGVAS